MTVKAILKQSIARNGVGAFILPCKKINLQYCNWGGSSQGMRDFLRLRLSKIASAYPKIEFNVVKKSGHPVVAGQYTTAEKQKAVCVKNMNIDEVENKIKLLIDSSGAQLKKHKQPVESLNESIRGVWSPFHVNSSVRHKI